MAQLCRACLVAKESFTFALFKNVPADVYTFCTSVEVTQDDELPQTLCDTCYDLLQKFSNFKNACIQSQNTLAFQNNMELPFRILNSSIQGPDVKCELNESFEMEVSVLKVKKEDVRSNNGDEDLSVDDTNNLDNSYCTNDYNDTIQDICHGDDYDDQPLQENKKGIKCTIKKIKVNTQTEEKKKPRVLKYVCGLCKSKFKYKHRYEAHLLEHQGQTVNKTCPICKKVFMTWSGLHRHTDSEHKVVRLTTLRCKLCGKVFKNQQTLKLHAKMHALPEDHLSVCDVCGKSYSSPVTLKLHLARHNENRARDYPCEHCGKKFFTKHILHSHIKRLHTGQRYICHICNYPFTDKYNLQKHVLKIHQGVKDNKCDICNKYFSSHSTLVIHKRIHSGERPYGCSYCDKAFSSKNRQIVHHRTHTGERPYRCDICNLAFTQHSTLKRHLKTHNKIPVVPTGADVFRYEKPPDCLALA